MVDRLREFDTDGCRAIATVWVGDPADLDREWQELVAAEAANLQRVRDLRKCAQ